MTDYMDYTAAEIGGGGGDPLLPPQRRLPPTITLPQRSSLDILVAGLSPGPMTLVSNFFSDHYPDTDLRSFSQLLNETMPIVAAQNPPVYHDTASNCQKQSEHQNHQVFDSRSDNGKLESVVIMSKPANDGYKWRKYGQKQVKGSELPRSYYKCTQTNCPATKKIGHFLNGDVSDIMYKGQHNHEPHPVRILAKNATMCQQVNHMVANEVVCDAVSPKKRKMDFECVDQESSSRVIVTEQKIVVQTRSEVDILDDGFKWRKYGQKVVKGTTYPRCYYRCAYAGCKVRKHVERVYLDPESVITTYEGKHEHVIPVLAKHSSHNEANIKTEIALLHLKEEEQIAS